ncbi:hypothetical protein MTAT_08170 [Moorella thermoacetica]|uniref:Uncharacterized protein n=1 Tax=Neomoorella thermoacetica TaxID=1525 RepID=A0ABY3N8F6_NEOTH|nr:hypothetical protein MTAT_08170 [Moorella thermoacetica]
MDRRHNRDGYPSRHGTTVSTSTVFISRQVALQVTSSPLFNHFQESVNPDLELLQVTC